uniref:Uncharacterized protein n=1 Tax=Trieres chinensis TaxID=1514140 RepID=A0A7S1ZII2_TRICV
MNFLPSWFDDLSLWYTCATFEAASSDARSCHQISKCDRCRWARNTFCEGMIHECIVKLSRPSEAVSCHGIKFLPSCHANDITWFGPFKLIFVRSRGAQNELHIAWAMLFLEGSCQVIFVNLL